MELQLIPLGINGYYPSRGRHTASYLLRAGSHAILLDAGTGLCRLGDQDIRDALNGCDRLDVLLSHYHLDHVVGLFFLAAVWEQGPVRIFGPAPPLVEGHPRDALANLFRPPLSPKSIEALIEGVTIHDIVSPSWSLGDIPVRCWPQRHPGGSVGLRFGDALAYMTDRAMDWSHTVHARGVQLLLHEVWLTDDEAKASPEDLEVHCGATEVARFAREAGVKSLMPIHHHPDREEAEIQALCRAMGSAAGVPVLVPAEGHIYPLGGL